MKGSFKAVHVLETKKLTRHLLQIQIHVLQSEEKFIDQRNIGHFEALVLHVHHWRMR